MDTKEMLTIIGWPVTVLLGIVSGGIIVPRLTRKRQILTWAIMNESDLVPRELSKTLGIAVTLQVGDARPASLSALTIRIGNSGNEVIKDLTIVIVLNEGASILNVRFVSDAGEYASHVRWSIDKGTCRVAADFINQDHHFELELLSSDYDAGSADLDASAPGVELRRTNAKAWDAVVRRALFSTKGVKFSIPFTGIGYDSGSAAMSEVAEEIRALRKYLSRQQ